MPLANYIVKFLDLDRKAQAKAVLAGKYTASQLESLRRHSISLTVTEMIETVLNHAVSSPHPVEKANVHPVNFSESLNQAAYLVNHRYEILTKPARAASRAVIEIGIIMLAVKDQLPRGSLEKWRDGNTKLSKTWDHYCRKAAQQFIDEHGMRVAGLLCDPSQAEDERDVAVAEQLLMDFTGGKGPSALLHDLGIKKRPAPEKGEPLTPEERDARLAEVSWTEIINTIDRHADDWMNLTDAQIAAIDQILWPIASSIHKATKGKEQRDKGARKTSHLTPNTSATEGSLS